MQECCLSRVINLFRYQLLSLGSARVNNKSNCRKLVIGRWSVDMFAMFHLGRIDVLPVGDLGIRNGMKLLYGLPVCTLDGFTNIPSERLL